MIVKVSEDVSIENAAPDQDSVCIRAGNIEVSIGRDEHGEVSITLALVSADGGLFSVVLGQETITEYRPDGRFCVRREGQ